MVFRIFIFVTALLTLLSWQHAALPDLWLSVYHFIQIEFLYRIFEASLIFSIIVETISLPVILSGLLMITAITFLLRQKLIRKKRHYYEAA